MYSMVLMMAMTTTPDITAHGGGYTSCNGCTGSSCNGCTGNSCHGGGFLGMKKGGGLFGGGLFGKHKSKGCDGGSCNGCHGGVAPMMEVAPVVQPDMMAPVYPAPTYPTGCDAAPLSPIHGSPIIQTTPIMEGTIGSPKPEMKKEEPKKMPELKKDEQKPDPKQQTMAPAKIELNVPQGAKVTINGLDVAGNSNVRYFATRNLSTDAKEVYTVSVEVVRNGQTLVGTEKVTVKGGETTSLTINPTSNDLVSK